MKKVLIFVSLIAMALGMTARDYPDVIVRKHNGGFWAIFNLYNDVEYTPADGEGGLAELDCSGNGFTFCRVPMLAVGGGSSREDAAESRALTNAVNQMIEYSENQSPEQTRFSNNVHTITVAIPATANRAPLYYQVKGVWGFEANGDCVMKISIQDVSEIYNRTR
ncbi:MAG: hypothetical protein J6T86_09415 [Bacteroidales bacterium]|nr:hypothetical protein [Bacteroidales bacterium]